MLLNLLGRQLWSAPRWTPAVSHVWRVQQARQIDLFSTGTPAASTSVPSEGQQADSSKGVIWIGNVNWKATEAEIKQEFAAYNCSKVYILRYPGASRATPGRSKGMALVSVDNDKLDQAIREVNGRDFQGRTLKAARSIAQEIKEKQSKPRDRRTQAGPQADPQQAATEAASAAAPEATAMQAPAAAPAAAAEAAPETAVPKPAPAAATATAQEAAAEATAPKPPPATATAPSGIQQ